MASHAETCALVTGGTQGLGRAIAERLLAEGCKKLVIASLEDQGSGDSVARALSRDGARVSFIAVDMADLSAVDGMVASAADRMGRVTSLVNAAGTANRSDVLTTTPEQWDMLMAVNARGPFFAIQNVANRAIKAGHGATVVNILSMTVHCGQSYLAPYSASKAALANVTRNAANFLRNHHIRVNGICPGWMDTPGEDAAQRRWHGAGDDWLRKAEAAQPLGMLVKPAHLAGLAAYMLGPGSGVMTGAVVDFDQTITGAYPE